MSGKLLLATSNEHKKKELKAILRYEGVEILTLEDIGKNLPPVIEDGESFAENAAKKARLTAAASGCVCLADDSGLQVEALKGQPGVYSARFAGEKANDEENNAKLLTMIQYFRGEQRKAEFVCVIAVSDPDGMVKTVRGVCPGHINDKPLGKNGFGYDPLFIPQGYSRTFAQLSETEKNVISHRAKALKEVYYLLKEFNLVKR
ncbi:MAG: XTP/dITP diphosphatase [Syntrophomonadaceae bacterium]|jgi:XTP/dITP diphosphohydrolase|nr:XTP/dITP diphosphatase [Syntrophomonadaceae bacterium]